MSISGHGRRDDVDPATMASTEYPASDEIFESDADIPRVLNGALEGIPHRHRRDDDTVRDSFSEAEHSGRTADGVPSAQTPDVDWVMPEPSESNYISEGDYAGRPRVGEAGEMERIRPSILGNLRGGHRPEAMVDAGYVSEDIYLGAVSLRGPAHHHVGAPRQDHYAIGVEGDWLIAIVADGVSQGSLSHLAAERVTQTALIEIRSAIRQGDPKRVDWQKISNACRESVRRLGLQVLVPHLKNAGESVDPSDVTDSSIAKHLATTCDIVVCAVKSVDRVHAAMRVTICGDGSAYIIDPTLGWKRLGAGKTVSDGVVNNAVIPIPIDPGPPLIVETTLHAGQALVLCTDGFGDLIETGKRPVGRYLFNQWKVRLDTTRLLRTASFVNINGDDDRTAVIIWALP